MNMDRYIAVAWRFSGDIGNIVLVMFFGYLTLRLKEMALLQFEAGGGLSALAPDRAHALLVNPLSATTYWHFAASWVLAVACCGTAWMTILGCRWVYHWILRILD